MKPPAFAGLQRPRSFTGRLHAVSGEQPGDLASLLQGSDLVGPFDRREVICDSMLPERFGIACEPSDVFRERLVPLGCDDRQ